MRRQTGGFAAHKPVEDGRKRSWPIVRAEQRSKAFTLHARGVAPRVRDP
jgi:hypothetical protein